MKSVGLIGGMSWESTAIYYRHLNQGVSRVMGAHHSAPCIIHSLDFALFERLSHEQNWPAIATLLAKMALDLEKMGVEALAICSNTAHKVADEVTAAIDIPLLHIADATGTAIRNKKLEKIALLGTRFTMEESFYRQRLEENFSCVVDIPATAERDLIHQIIYEELCQGTVTEKSKNMYLQIIREMVTKDCQGVILGCTEIGMLISQDDLDVPVLDTALIHCDAIVSFMTTE